MFQLHLSPLHKDVFLAVVVGRHVIELLLEEENIMEGHREGLAIQEYELL